MKTPTTAATPKPMVSSSPGRPEKLPAPGLALLLRGKSAGRSRARSAASPMFVSRSKSAGRSSSSSSAIDPALPEAGDPSSPKVTCIGQVRIRNRNRNTRKKNKSNSTAKTSSRSADPHRCQCLCRPFPCRSKKCYSPYRFFFCWRKQKKNVKEAAKAEEAAPPIAFVREFKIKSDSEGEDEEEEEEAGEEETRVFVSSSSAAAADESATSHSSEDAAPPPPKNALLLMRCRSAPHNRSSAVALSRFSVSPVPASETEEDEQTRKAEEETIEERGRESCGGSAKDEEESRSSSSSRAPAGLMRCKSEPAKMAERLMEVSYCKWNGSGKGGTGVVQEVGTTLPPPPPPPLPPILLH